MLRAIASRRTGGQAVQAIELTATNLAFQFQVYIGPPWEHWPSGLKFAWNQSAPDLLSFQTTTTTIFDESSSTLDLTDASGLPPFGMVWVNGNPLAYTGKSGNSLSGLTPLFEPFSAAIGSPVRVFWPITNYHVNDISFRAGLRGRVFSWQAKLSFFQIPKGFLSQDYSICVLRRKNVNGSWGAWHVWFMGWISDIFGRKDYVDTLDVDITVRGLTYKLENALAPDLTRGGGGGRGGREPPVVEGVNTRASSILTDLFLEATSDDWILGEPESVDSDNVVDGDLSTVWISEGEPNNVSWETPAPTFSGCVDEVFMLPWPGYGSEYQWFRIWIVGNFQVGQIRIYNHQTTWNGNTPTGYYLDLKDSALADQVVTNKPIILCYNATAFRSMFDPGDVPIIEWSALQGHSKNARRFHLGFTSGFIYITTKFAGFNDGVAWGDGSDTPSGFPFGFWSGRWVKRPARGHAIRRSPPGADTNTASDWIEEESPAPGEYRGKPRPQSADAEWIAADFGEFDWRLGQNLAADSSDPADGVIKIRPEGGSSDFDTSGLDDSGYIRVGLEIIQYSGRTEDALTGVVRGALGTKVSAHSDGERVYQIVNGLATRARKISSIQFIRKEGLWPIPYAARVLVSKYDLPRFPPTDNWQLDWSKPVKTWSRNKLHVMPVDFPEGRRIRWAMMIIDQMGSVVGRTERYYPAGTTQIEVIPGRWFDKMPSSGNISVGEFRVSYTKGSGTTLNLGSSVGPVHEGVHVVYLGGRARLNEIRITQLNMWDKLR